MKAIKYPSWFVPLDIAQQLKEIGFDKPILFHYYEHDFDIVIETNSYYDEGEAQGYLHFYISAFKEENFNRDKKCISLPTWEQVFEWFREKKLFTVIEYEGNDVYTFRIVIMNTPSVRTDNKKYFSYEEAREALIKELIRIYKKWKQYLKLE